MHNAHRQCLLDDYQSPNCPACTHPITSTSLSGTRQVLCNLNNEGGLQADLDILPVLVEESYLKSYPRERKCRAFLEFCREGDMEAIVDLLNDPGQDENDGNDNEEEDSMEYGEAATHPLAVDILRYQDPLGSMYSGLHLAVISAKTEIIWFLLFLASKLNLNLFPHEVLQAAEEYDLTGQRNHGIGRVDIRMLKDTDERTAVQHTDAGLIGNDLMALLAPPHE